MLTRLDHSKTLGESNQIYLNSIALCNLILLLYEFLWIFGDMIIGILLFCCTMRLIRSVHVIVNGTFF